MEKNWDEIAHLFLIDSRIKISYCRDPELTVCRGFIFDKLNIKIHISKKTKTVTRGRRMVWERKWRKSFLMSSTVTKSHHLRDFRVMCFTVFFKSLGKQQKKYCSSLQDLKNVEKMSVLTSCSPAFHSHHTAEEPVSGFTAAQTYVCGSGR